MIAPRQNLDSQIRSNIAWFAAVTIIFCAVILRVTVIDDTRQEMDLRIDSIDYFMYAYNISNTGTYSKSRKFFESSSTVEPDADRPPLFPLAASIWIDKGTPGELRSVTYFLTESLFTSLLLYSLFAVFLFERRKHAVYLVVAGLISPGQEDCILC